MKELSCADEGEQVFPRYYPNMSPPNTPVSPLEALKVGFRRACVRRLVGDEAGAIDVLKNEIPKLVVGGPR